jgi:hypothetical protein
MLYGCEDARHFTLCGWQCRTRFRFGPRSATAGLSSIHRLINAARKKAYPINDSLRVGDNVGDRSDERVDRRGTHVQRWGHR